MKGVSNEGQFKKARKEMPDFFKDSSSAKKDKANVMDKANPKALRLANGGSARQPRDGNMKFVKGGKVKRNMGGMIPPVVDGVEQMMGKPMKPPMLQGQGATMGGPDPMMGQGRNPPALGIGRGGQGIGRMRPGAGPQGPGPQMGGPTPRDFAAAPPVEQINIGGDGPAFKRGGAVPRNKGARFAKGGALTKAEDKVEDKKLVERHNRLMHPGQKSKVQNGGAPIKRAMGGVGKYRHQQSEESGKPKAAPKGKKLFEAI